jgi:hypothetical protein
MNKEQIIPTEILIKDKKTSIKGYVTRVAVFAGSKVIHVKTTGTDDFYLLYFNHTFVFGDYLKEVKDSSFIGKVFCKGLVIDASHPLISAFIPNQTVNIPNRNKVFSQLLSHFTPQETAYIVTCLDSFFDKEQLIKFIEQIYFEFRRNGKFLKAFQVLQISKEFIPHFNERLTSREFHSYDNFYQTSDLRSIFHKDPLYAELFCYKNRTNQENFTHLIEILKTKENYAELILLWLEGKKNYQPVDTIEQITPFALKFITMKEWIVVLGHEKINSFHELPNAKKIIEDMLDNGEYEKAALSLFHFMNDLPPTYHLILQRLWKNLKVDFLVTNLEYFISIFQKQENEEYQSEEQIYLLIVRMLKGFDLKTVYEKLEPLRMAQHQSIFLRKLTKMVRLLEDPDHMMELGDDFAEFKQYDHAIDCYSWEMELKPMDPNPVWKISKMYQHLGMVKEASEYQRFYSQLKNA